MNRRVVNGIASIIVIAALPALAQIGGSGSVQGVVSDPSGAVIPGVKVVGTNVNTGVRTERQSTASGLYNLSPLQPGEYTVTASAAGFETLTQRSVVVDALSVATVNLTLKVGATTEEITVTAAPPALNTNDASLGQTIRNDLYTALPLQMGNAPRDPTAFTQLMPGVTTSSATGNTAGNILGAQDHSQEIYIEGLPVTNPVGQGETRTLGLGISVEAVDQFQMETAGTAAMFGGQGAANFVLKSGTNQFHGAGFEYFRNTALDARGFFAKTTPVEHQNEFGFNFGGPIRRNKIFFFGNYDGYRFTQGAQPNLQTVPTAQERLGDFSAVPVKIYDPGTTDCSKAPCTRQAFPNNVIPGSRISAISKTLQAALPDTSNGNIQSNFLGTVPVGYHDNSTTDKVDVNLNDRNTLYVLFSHGHRLQTTGYRGQTLPLPYANTRLVDEIPTTAQAKYTYVITPNLLNQVSYGFSRLAVPITNATIQGDWATKAGITGLPPGEAASSFPEISWTGPNSPDGWRGTNSRAFNDVSNTFTLQDNVQWTHGKHALTFGGQVAWLQINEKQRTYGSLATWNFSNTQTAAFGPTGTLQTATGNAYASYLLGAVNSANVVEDSVVETGGRYKNYAWWVQDNYRVTSRLTLNLGLRHEILTPYVEVLNRESFFNPTAPNPAAGGVPGILQFYGNGTDSCHCRSTVKTDYKDLGPRVGLAYRIGNKTVVRSGYSIMYAHRGAVGGRGGGRFGTDILGFSASPTFSSPDQGISPAFNWNSGVPAYQHPPFFDPAFGTGYNGTTSVPATITYGDPSIGGRPPRYQNWNLSVERSLPGGVTMGAAYVGSNGHFLGGGGRGVWSDQIDPKYLVLGNLLQASATAANLAAANKILPGIALPYPTFTGSISQMLRPFPQYNGINDVWGDVGNSNYNSLQITGVKSLSRGVSFNFNYTYAKAIDDTASGMVTGQSASQRSAYNWTVEKAQTQLPTHVLNFIFAYESPFGKGGMFAANKIVDAMAGHWRLSGITTYRSGTLIGTIGAACNLPNAGGCYASYNPAFQGPARINGNYGSGDLLGSAPPSFLDKNAFISPAAYTYGNTPRTGAYNIHNPDAYGQDLSLRRNFPIRERVALSIQADAFNVLNFVTFSAPATNITSANFGRITSASNSPRSLQLGARITF